MISCNSEQEKHKEGMKVFGERSIVLTSAIHQLELTSHHKQMFQTYVRFICYIQTVYQCVVRDEVIMEGVGQH